MIKNINNILLGLLIFICGYLFVQNIKLKNINISNYESYEQKIKVYKDKYNRVVSQKDAVVISLKHLKTKTDTLENMLKNVKPDVVIKYRTKIEYKDTTIIKFKEPIAHEFSRDIVYKDKFFEEHCTITNKDFRITYYKVVNEQDIIWGRERRKLFAPYVYTATIYNSNPNVEVLNMQTYRVIHKTPLIEKPWLWGIGGLVLGAILMK